MVEKNNVGVALIQRLLSLGVDIDSFVTSKYNKDNIIRLLKHDMTQKRFKIPPKGSEVFRLRDELTKFGVKIVRTRGGGSKETMAALSGHDDLVMSTAIANHAAEEYGSGSAGVICQD